MDLTIEELAVTYSTLLTLAVNTDSDSKACDDLLAAATFTAEQIKIKAELPHSAVLREMPFSEVCVHMKVAGKPMWTEVTSDHGVQLYTLEGQKFSMPILHGEAGLHFQDLALPS